MGIFRWLLILLRGDIYLLPYAIDYVCGMTGWPNGDDDKDDDSDETVLVIVIIHTSCT